MTSFEKVGANLKLGIVEMKLYQFFLDYSFNDRHNNKEMCSALLLKFSREIAETLNFNVPEEYGRLDTTTEYGSQPLHALASLSENKVGDVL